MPLDKTLSVFLSTHLMSSTDDKYTVSPCCLRCEVASLKERVPVAGPQESCLGRKITLASQATVANVMMPDSERAPRVARCYTYSTTTRYVFSFGPVTGMDSVES